MGETRPYGCAMHQAIAKGDLEEMRAAADAAKQHLREYGNVALTLEVLKAEINKLEAQEQKFKG